MVVVHITRRLCSKSFYWIKWFLSFVSNSTRPPRVTCLRQCRGPTCVFPLPPPRCSHAIFKINKQRGGEKTFFPRTLRCLTNRWIVHGFFFFVFTFSKTNLIVIKPTVAVRARSYFIIFCVSRLAWFLCRFSAVNGATLLRTVASGGRNGGARAAETPHTGAAREWRDNIIW